ncbi:30S ribosomal protein S5 [uncultured archaeon]|nr:30S ribosomal protein S5 [uncultured archaeon]
MTKKEKDVSSLKKTAEAYGTLSETEAQNSTKDAAKVTNKIIEEAELSEEEKVLKKMKEDEILEKELKKTTDRRGRRMTPEEEVQENLKVWKPRTKLGKEVREGKIKNIDQILDSNRKILEPEIVDSLLNVKFDLLSIGQSKGKFGGGKRRAWRQTQRKTKEGNVPTFSAFAVVGDEKGHIGVGYGRAKETLPGRDKAIRKAKLNITKITRDCASFDCNCGELHTVPFKVEGKGGSCRVVLIPAPQGTGLVAANELKKILKIAGIKDVYSKTFGTKATTFNLAKACMDALEKTNRSKK